MNILIVDGNEKEASDKYCMPIKEILTLIPEDY